MGILAASRGKGPAAHLTEATLKKVLCWEAPWHVAACMKDTANKQHRFTCYVLFSGLHKKPMWFLLCGVFCYCYLVLVFFFPVFAVTVTVAIAFCFCVLLCSLFLGSLCIEVVLLFCISVSQMLHIHYIVCGCKHIGSTISREL